MGAGQGTEVQLTVFPMAPLRPSAGRESASRRWPDGVPTAHREVLSGFKSRDASEGECSAAAVLGVWKNPLPRVTTSLSPDQGQSEGYPAVTRVVGSPSKWAGARPGSPPGACGRLRVACTPVVLPEEGPLR